MYHGELLAAWWMMYRGDFFLQMDVNAAVTTYTIKTKRMVRFVGSCASNNSKLVVF